MTTRALLFLAALAGLALPAADPTQAQATPGGDWRTDVRDYADEVTDQGGAAGLGVAVVIGDRVAYSQGFGLADAESGIPVDAGTRFYIASSTKALTATAVVALAEQGVIDLAAPVTTYLPNLEFGNGVEADEVTIHDLLSMTEGINDAWPVIFRTAYTGDFTPGQLIELLADYEASEDGRAFEYGNLAYNILGLVLDAVDGEGLAAGGWKAPVRRTVLEPLGMVETTALLSSLEADRIAMPHALAPSGRFERIGLAKDDSNMHAAGGHLASARSLARFVAVHVGGGTLDGRRIFPQAMIENIQTQQARQDRTFAGYERDGWGYGWDRTKWQGRRMLQRFGAFSGYFSHMSFLPEEGIGVVVLSNDDSGGQAAELVARFIYDRLLGRDDLQSHYDKRLKELRSMANERAKRIEKHLAERADRLAPLPYDLAAYAGSYHNDDFGTMHWQVVAGGLEVRMGAIHNRAEIFDASINALRVTPTGSGSVVVFEFEPDAETARRVKWNGVHFERTERYEGRQTAHSCSACSAASQALPRSHLR